VASGLCLLEIMLIYSFLFIKHLVGPLGFRLDAKEVKRAGLDYWPHVDLHRYDGTRNFCIPKT
jgi:tRNA(Leu) C34 or U34 (ribose-2'-O)-methylase TrmL